MNENSYSLIQKLIETTKNHNLHWHKFNAHKHSLKPLKQSIFSDEQDFITEPCYEASYTAQYNDTEFFLIVFSGMFGGVFIKLQVQTNTSNRSKVYASSFEDDEVITSELKRLYNIVEELEDPIDESVRSFLDE